MGKSITITGAELKHLKDVRNYFGEHDVTIREHMDYHLLDNLINRAEDKSVTLKSDSLLTKEQQQIAIEIIANLFAGGGYRDSELSDFLKSLRKRFYVCKIYQGDLVYLARHDGTLFAIQEKGGIIFDSPDEALDAIRKINNSSEKSEELFVVIK